MKFLATAAALALSCLAANSQAADLPAKDSPAPQTQTEKIGYLIGHRTGQQMKNDGVQVDVAAFARGLADGLAGSEIKLSKEEQAAVFEAFQKEMQAKAGELAAAREKELKAAAVPNKKLGDAFLTENKKKEGVKTTASGLQYKILKVGMGPKPKASDLVTADYEGKLINGTVFDSSYKRGKPADFPVQGVIPGWTEALLLMPVGSTWELYIPSDLAYGDAGFEDDIPPGATLIFKLELKDAKPLPARQPGGLPEPESRDR